MEKSGGAMPAKRAKPSAAAGEDRLSSLPDEVLVLILLRLGTAAAAGRTSVLSRRWRRVWALLPELRFPAAPSPHAIASAIAAHEAEAALRHLLVEVEDAAPGSLAAWLPTAARRLSGTMVLTNRAAGGNRVGAGGEEASQGGAFDLPCFERATSVSLDLGFLGLAVPPAGVFARLTELSLNRVRFQGLCELGDAISSSPRFPCLQELRVSHARGLENIAIHSESLLRVDLRYVDRLQQLTIVAPALQGLRVRGCFDRPQDIGNSEYSMQRLTVLPRIKTLTLILNNKGHNFGASLFHILSLCTCLAVLRLWLDKAQSESACPSGCICDQPTNWKTEELILERLQEVVIIEMKGSGHELTLMERLFCWAVKLKKLRLMYHTVTISKGKEVQEKLLSLAMPETHVTLEELR